MFENYLKTTFRNFWRHKLTSFINVFSLSVGISAAMLIFLYVRSELRYDQHHPFAERIFRVPIEITSQGKTDKFGLNNIVAAQELKAFFPDVVAYLRLMPQGRLTISYENNFFNEDNLAYADSSLFTFFDYPILKGNPKTALKEPNTLIMSEEKAIKYFGNIDEAMGKALKINQKSYQVTGIIRTKTRETQVPYDIFLSISSLPDAFIQQSRNDWMYCSSYNYIMLQKGVSKAQFESKLKTFYAQKIAPWVKENKLDAKIRYHIQPLAAVHLSIDYPFDFAGNNNPAYLYIFSVVGVFIILIAVINYMNLATARSAKRAKEVGLRKVIGANRSQLIAQFMGESLIITFLAVILAIGLAEILLPTFNNLSGKNFGFYSLFESEFLLALLGLTLLIGGLAGLYPAFYLSGFQPILVLKSQTPVARLSRNLLNSTNLRKVLVVTQFALSIALIIGTIIVFAQINFMQNKELGFNKAQTLVIDIPNGDTAVLNNLQTIKNEFLKNPAITQVATASSIPGGKFGKLHHFFEREGKDVMESLNFMYIDDEFFKLLDVKVVKGRNFSKDIKTDGQGGLIMNEAAAKFLRWKEPIDKKITNGLMVKIENGQPAQAEGKVLGVVKDFNYTSLQNPIEPLVMMYAPKTQGFLLLKVAGNQLAQTVNFVREKWQSFDRKHPMDYFFLDNHLDKLYEKEQKLLTIFGYFAMLTVIIAALGLFGLASYATEQRIKEIGIRKVMGASVWNITGLITQEFAQLVAFAMLFAFPMAYFAMHTWLQDFAYRISIGWLPFALSGFLALLIAVLTVSALALRAATHDPVKALRYE
ncbi:MAG: ABC transporter permease [Microscillaceae bacterium]|jgi:putative ABC transport system permease protein|nr:ABC transporter permease [Microscillaceae bacterium]